MQGARAGGEERQRSRAGSEEREQAVAVWVLPEPVWLHMKHIAILSSTQRGPNCHSLVAPVALDAVIEDLLAWGCGSCDVANSK